MKKACVLLGIFIFTVSFLFPQDYKGRARIKGIVTDQAGNPIEGVKVKLVYSKVEDGFEVMTDSEGRWVASWLKGGKWDVDFEKMGYSSKKISITVKEGTRNSDVGIELEKMRVMTMSEELKEGLDRANGLYKAGKFEESIEAYEVILEKFPDVFITNANIGNISLANLLQNIEQNRLIGHRQKVLGHSIGNRSEPRSPTTTQDQCFHYFPA